MANRVIQQNITVKPGGQVVTYLRSPKHLTGKNYMRIFADTLCEISLDKELTGSDLRVLNIILCGMEYGNLYSQPQTAIAELLGTGQRNVAASIKKLIAKNLIKVIDQIGRQNIYMVNPELALKDFSGNLNGLEEKWLSYQTK
jgi:chromosome segregation and condensation protein ScpB